MSQIVFTITPDLRDWFDKDAAKHKHGVSEHGVFLLNNARMLAEGYAPAGFVTIGLHKAVEESRDRLLNEYTELLEQRLEEKFARKEPLKVHLSCEYDGPDVTPEKKAQVSLWLDRMAEQISALILNGATATLPV